MNVYGVDAGEQYIIDRIDEWGGPREYYQAVHVVAAKSRGHARAIVATLDNLEFTEPMRIRKLGTIERDTPGDLDDPQWWYEFSRVFHPDTFSESDWQEYLTELSNG